MSRTTNFVRFLLASVLLAAALALWSTAAIADDLASRHERMAMFADPGPEEARAGRWLTAAVRNMLDPAAAAETSTRDYWLGRYDAFTNNDPAVRDREDAASQLVAANATFRQAQRAAVNGPLSADALDRSLQAYAAVLKNSGFDRDAAWNYEFIARLRDEAARDKPAGRQAAGRTGSQAGPLEPRGARTPPPVRADRSGLPSGPTIHGRPGAHPPSTKGEEFEVITPMDYGDREAQPEPTPGVKLPRKG